jgi:Protein of unknown function (DUF3303)
MKLKVMIVWKSHPGTHADALRKFVDEGGMKVQPGIHILSAVHGIGCGFILLESADYGAVADFCSDWQTVVSVEPHIVIDDAQLLEHHKQKLQHRARA